MLNKFIVFTFLLLASSTVPAQQKITQDRDPATPIQTDTLTPEKSHKLYVLGKVWGFVKYFHPTVGDGKVDWDLELEQFVPGYLNTKTMDESKDSLLAWINRLGDIPEHKSPDYDTIKKYKLKPDFSWISEKTLGAALAKKLHFILMNREHGDQHYVKFYKTGDLNIPVFQHEKRFKSSICPPAAIRLIALYRFWNVIEYLYPYKYNLPKAWDQVLTEQLPLFLAADNLDKYTLAVMRLLATIHDGHVTIMSTATNVLKGYYYMPVRFKYIQNKIIISSISNDSVARAAGLVVGDVIGAIDGITAEQIIQEKLPYTSGSNLPDQLHAITRELNRTNEPTTVLKINDGKNTRTVTVTNFFTKKPVNQYVSSFAYQRDSSSAMLGNNIAYLNMGKLTLEQDSAKIVSLIDQCDALIIDARQNAVEDEHHQNPIGLMERLLCNGKKPFIFSVAQPDFPGVFQFGDNDGIPITVHEVKYNKPIVILINEEVKSIGEFLSMIFSRAPQATLMGSTTSGTDGLASNLVLPGIFISFTGTGMYWANGDETQRVGIKPDIEAYPTINGYRNNKDEVLEKAAAYLAQKRK